MQDRIPLYPGRVTLTPVAGQTNTYDMVRADQPTQEGTPLNKANLLTDTTAALYGLEGVVPNDIFSWLGKYNEYWWRLLHSTGETTYAHSTDRDAYPDSGTVDGITYSYLGVPFEKFPTMPQIEAGSYTGTGTYGSGNPNSLTFGFEPKAVFILSNTAESSMMMIRSASYATANLATYGGINRVIYSGKTVSWYWISGGNSYTYQYVQANGSGIVHYYIAIG